MSSFKSSYTFSLFLLKKSLYWVIITACSISLCLLIGQWIKLRTWLWPIPFDDLERYIRILGGGYLIVLEASLPLMCLVSLGGAYSYFRRHHIPNSWFLIGGSPTILFLPALLIGIITSGLTAWIAHQSTPSILKGMHSDLTQLVHQTWLAPNQGHRFKFGGIRVFKSSSTDHELLIYLHQNETLIRGFIKADEITSYSLKSVSPNSKLPNSLTLTLTNVDLWSPQGKLSVSQFNFDLNQDHLIKSLKMLGPPNSLSSSDLDFTDPHQAFTGYKRWSLSLSAILWAFIGALLGLLPSMYQALTIGTISISGAYSLLRYLELKARFAQGSAFWAAWSPCLYLILILGGLFIYWKKQELENLL